MCINFMAALILLFVCTDGATGADISRATLKNGLQVVVVRNPLAPVAAVQVNYLVGSDESPPGFPGMAHAQEHTMFRGSPGLSASQLASLIAALGGEFNADTQQTVTQYTMTVPAEDLEIALHIEATRMRGVMDTEKLWESERGAIEQEVVRDLSNPEYLLEKRLFAALFNGTPYEHDALGSRQSFDKTTGAMMKSFHDDWYAPNNAVLVVIGGVDPDDTMAAVRRLFEPIPSRRLPDRPVFEFKPLKPEFFEMETDEPYGLALVAYRLPGFASPDYAAGQVLSDVLSSQRGAYYATRLYHDLREQAGLVYTVEAFLEAGRTRSVFGVEYGCDPKNVSKAWSVIERNLYEMQKKSVSQVELRQAKTLLLRKELLSLGSTEDIALSLLNLSQEGLYLEEPHLAAMKYRSITAKQIMAAFAKWIRPAAFVQITLGPLAK